MPSILIVEDEVEKRKEIVRCLISVEGVHEDDIETVVDAGEAKKILSEKKYDLVLLDINLPKNKSSDISHNGGLDVVSFIQSSHRVIKPDHVIAVSAYQDSLKEAEEAFPKLFWGVLKFSFSDNSWQKPLQEAAENVVARDVPPFPTDGATYKTDAAIVVALDTVELEAVLALPIEWKEQKLVNDTATYYTARYRIGEKDRKLVLAAAPRMGLAPAAVATTKMIENFRPKYVAMAGICAGIRDKTDLGDVLGADPVWDWGSGKWLETSTGSLSFAGASYQWRLQEDTRQVMKSLGRDIEFFRNLWKAWEGPKRPEVYPKLKVGAMASGAAVLQSEDVMKKIGEQQKDLIGVEMEVYGVFTAVEYAVRPKPICFSLKSVCDFGDVNKEDGFQTYAAYTSAHSVFEVIRRLFLDAE